MLFNSINYLLFYPIVFLLNFLLPKKVRYLWLLAASYFFYMCWNAEYALLMLTSTLITFASGLFIEKFRSAGKPGLAKLSVGLSFASNLLILIFFKYENFLSQNLNALFTAMGLSLRVPYLDVLLPVGISFFTFQALSYTMDVYRKDIDVERNVFRYALFVSFFPQLVAGPIERSGNLLTQLRAPKDFNAERARRGLLVMAWGLFLKVVLADNLARVVNPVYDSFMNYSGIELVLATCLFAFQIYCDFAGYSYIAIGSADILGVSLMENFRCPYLAVSVKDFWHRWHISLSTWFSDYLYIPLGGNRKGKARKYINTMIVFFVSGLWHGANWTFVVWGVLNGVMIVLSDMTKGLREKVMRVLKVDPHRFSHKLFRRVLTFLLIGITWVFFRAPDLSIALQIFGRIFGDLQLPKLFSPAIFDMLFHAQTAVLILLCVLALMVVDGMKYKGYHVDEMILRQSAPFRWTVYLGILFVIMAFGVYGNLFGQTQFIYFQF